MEAMLMAFVDDVRCEAHRQRAARSALRQLAAAHVRWRLEHPAIAEVFDIALGVRHARRTRLPRRAPPPHPRDQAHVPRRAARRCCRRARAAGTFDFADVRVTAFALVTLCGSAHTWYDPDGDLDRRRGRRDVRRLRRGHGARADARRSVVARARPIVARRVQGRGAHRAPARIACRRSPTRRSCRSASARTTCSPRSATTRSSSSRARPARARRRSCRRSASSSGAACAARSPTRSRGGSPRARSPSGSREELGVPLGEAVGYAVRFSDRSRRGHARAADDRRPAARRDPARPAAAPLRHDHHRRGARAQPQHRLPARLPRAAPARAGPT